MTGNGRRLHYLPAILLALVPACYICIAIYLYSVDLPHADEWGLATLHQRFANGTLSVADLFHQFNEYRQFLPNLVFVIAGYLTKGDLRLVMYLSFITACLISYNVYKLSAATLPVKRGERWWLLAAANVLMFSPVPVENWLQGQQLIYFIPAAALTTCLRIAYSDNSWPRLKLLSCSLLCVVSTFSSANGIICWLLMVPAILWSPAWSTLRHKLLHLCGWLVAFALCLGLYLKDYHKPAAKPALTHFLVQPLQDFLYWLSLLGRPFGFGRILLSILIGGLLVVLYVWATGRYLRHRTSAPDVASGTLCWLILGAYSIITGVLITIARGGYGVPQSLSNRYATFTLLLPVALLYLFGPVRTRSFRIAAIVVLLIVVHVPIYIFGIRNMRAVRAKALHDRICVHLINVVADDCLTQVYPDVSELRELANMMDQLGYLRPPLAKSGMVRALAATDAGAPESYGSFVEVKGTGPDDYGASGLARLPHRNRAADAVLLACENANREPAIIAMTTVTRDARWSKTFDHRMLPFEPCIMTAWAVDAESGKAFKISGTHTVEHK